MDSLATGLGVAVLALLAMEPATAALHRLLFHGPGFVLHRSHHRTRPGRFEANDVYPVILAGLTILVMAVGSRGGSLALLLPAGAGVTAYGLTYLVVHDLYIHRRLPLLPARLALLEPLAEAHRLHHRYGGAPFGMLCPLVPARLRADRRPAGGAGDGHPPAERRPGEHDEHAAHPRSGDVGRAVAAAGH